MKTEFISVDMQKDFTSEGGLAFLPRDSVRFILDVFSPYLFKRKIKVNEIISDYRQPRPGDRGDCCHPGEWGYESVVPQALVKGKRWVKCMNSPVWIRDGIGDPEAIPGLPFPDPDSFSNWLEMSIGLPDPEMIVVLLGLTLDCCVLCTAQELSFRGYKVRILEEATDVYSGDMEEKESLICKAPLTYWSERIRWEELKVRLQK